MDIYRAVIASWSVLLLVPHASLAGPQGPPPATVVHGDVVRIWDQTPTQYLARQIYEYSNTPPPSVPRQVHLGPDPVPISEPHGTTGWVPLMPPPGWHLPRPVPAQHPRYGPTTLVYPMEKPTRSFKQEPFFSARWKSDGPWRGAANEAVRSDDGQTRVPIAELAAPPTTEPGATVSAPAEEPVDTTPIVGSTDATFPAVTELAVTTHPTDGRNQSDFTVTERAQGDATRDGTTSDATVMPTEVRTVVTTGGDRERREFALASGAVAGIVVGAISLVALLTGLATYVVLRRPFVKLLNGNDKSSAENVAYIDDSLRSGYTNTHIELPKESSEEMTSLDNDSFLNSLEAVTIQNYWADSTNTKNTNV